MNGASGPRIIREQALAFRLEGHGLVARRPIGELEAVAGACGVRNTPPGSAGLALHARVADLAASAVDDALGRDKTLVEVIGMRASPHLAPATDLAIFTLGALPADDGSLRAALLSLGPQLDRAGVKPTEALRLTVEAAQAELDGRMLTRAELSAGLTGRLPEALGPWCPACKAHHVHEMLFRLAGVQGVYVMVRRGKEALFARTDQWIGVQQASDPHAARLELLQRYLRCFGPSSVEHFAAWVGITTADARTSWDTLANHLVEVNLEDRRAWLLGDDLNRLESPPQPSGVRLLPPYDSYLDQRDRATIVPDLDLHRRLWRAIGNPGAVLADGEIVGLWRPQKKGRRLIVAVEAFAPLWPHIRAEIEAEATLLAPHRGSAEAQVTFAD